MKIIVNKADIAKNLLRGISFLLLLIYMMMPFGKQATDLLHHLSHITVSVHGLGIHDHHSHEHHNMHGHSHGHHAHTHASANSGTEGHHAHELLDWINSLIDLATDAESTEYVVQKAIDKHVRNDQPLFHSPLYFLIKMVFSNLLQSVLEKHTFASIMPPDSTR